MESLASNVQQVQNVVKSASTLLNEIERDLPGMDARTTLILLRSLRLGIVLLERKTIKVDLTKTGSGTSASS